MAHTDKTRPEWVQLMDPTNRGWLKEHRVRGRRLTHLLWEQDKPGSIPGYPTGASRKTIGYLTHS